jgi:hypothetical protein
MDWPHALLHRFSDAPAVYFVTAATYLKQHFYRSADRLDALEAHVFDLATQFRCWLQAWAIFSNHYRRYRWCSASWFEREARQSFVESLKRFKIDHVNVPDDFEVLAPE